MSPKFLIIVWVCLVWSANAVATEIVLDRGCEPLTDDGIKKRVDRLVADETATTTIACNNGNIDISVMNGEAERRRQVRLNPIDPGASRTIATIVAELVRSTPFEAPDPKPNPKIDPNAIVDPKEDPSNPNEPEIESLSATVGFGVSSLPGTGHLLYGIEFTLAGRTTSLLSWRVAASGHLGAIVRTIPVDLFHGSIRPELVVNWTLESLRFSGSIGPQLGALVISPDRVQTAKTEQVAFFSRAATVGVNVDWDLNASVYFGVALVGGWAFGELRAVDTIDGDLVFGGLFGDSKLKIGFRF